MEEHKVIEFIPGDRLSYSTTLIKVLCNGHKIGVASGFVAKFGQHYGLVTNWHVVAGRNPLTNKIISSQAALPDALEVHVTVVTEEETPEGRSTAMFFKGVTLPLQNEDGSDVWVGLEEAEYRNDVVMIPLNDHIPELSNSNSFLEHINVGLVTLDNDVEATTEVHASMLRFFYPRVGRDVFILGYPRGVDFSGIFPIWKRGSVASEPQAHITSNGVTYTNLIYVDALTKEGMSGAPVVTFPREHDYMVTDKGGRVIVNDDRPIFIGVYAGRDGVTQEEYEFSLGRVWKAATVAKLFMKGPHNAKIREVQQPPTTR